MTLKCKNLLEEMEDLVNIYNDQIPLLTIAPIVLKANLLAASVTWKYIC